MALVMVGTHYQAVSMFSGYEGAPTKGGVSPHSVSRQSKVAVHGDTTMRQYEPSTYFVVAIGNCNS